MGSDDLVAEARARARILRQSMSPMDRKDGVLIARLADALAHPKERNDGKE
jgi:hypothetical protein